MDKIILPEGEIAKKSLCSFLPYGLVFGRLKKIFFYKIGCDELSFGLAQFYDRKIIFRSSLARGLKS